MLFQAARRLSNISNKIKLRPLVPSDAESVTKNANNINVWKNLTDLFPHPYTIKNANEFINSQIGKEPPNTFAVILKNNAIGIIGLSVNLDIKDQCGDIGYWIGEKYWNKGIGTQIIKSIVKFGFETYKNIECISASVFTDNPSSIRALEKSGFTNEKTIEKGLVKAGVKKDIHFFKITRKRANELRSI